jgi:hypothetical protein
MCTTYRPLCPRGDAVKRKSTARPAKTVGRTVVKRTTRQAVLSSATPARNRATPGLLNLPQDHCPMEVIAAVDLWTLVASRDVTDGYE